MPVNPSGGSGRCTKHELSMATSVSYVEQASDTALILHPTKSRAALQALAQSMSNVVTVVPVGRSLSETDLWIVNRLLVLNKGRPRHADRGVDVQPQATVDNWVDPPPVWAPPPTTPEDHGGAILVRRGQQTATQYPSRISRIDIYDDVGQSTSALDGLDDGLLALDALSRPKSREEFVGSAASGERDPEAPGSRGNARTRRQILRANVALMGSRTTLSRNIMRRPCQRPLSTAPQAVVDQWFSESGIMAGGACQTENQRQLAARLAYTYKDMFAVQLSDIKPTDLIEHTVTLVPGAIPYRLRQPRYTPRERDFAARIFPQMESVGWISMGVSAWGAYTRFPLKKDGGLRVTMDYRPVNGVSVKPQWPVHSKPGLFRCIATGDHRVFFQGDAAHGYWAVKMAPDHEQYTAFIAPNAQYLNHRMPQGMTGAPHTYCALGDIGFGAWPVGAAVEGPGLPSLIGHHPEWNTSFDIFVDDHNASARTWDDMFAFLLNHYFPRLAFVPIYLSPKKTVLFADQITTLGFEIAEGQTRPSQRHRERFANWARPENHPTNPKELESFLFLLPYLREYIPGRAERTLILKQAYMRQVNKSTSTGKVSIQREWVPSPWHWGDQQREAFVYICEQVQIRAIKTVRPNIQMHLSVDTSGQGIGAVLAQVPSQPVGTEISDKLTGMLNILGFMSWKLTDAETRYSAGEREALGMVQALTETRVLLMESPFPTLVYTDHRNLIEAFSIEGEPTGRIARWFDKIALYDIQIVHRPNTTRIIQIADGLSRLTLGRSETTRGDLDEDLPFTINNTTKPTFTARVVRKQATVIFPLQAGVEVTLRPEYHHSAFYHDVARFLCHGTRSLADKPQLTKRRVVRDAMWFRVREEELLRLERRGGQLAWCLTEEEVPDAVKWAHNAHGHFGVAMTLRQLEGRYWWPSRYKDVHRHVSECTTCAAVGLRRGATVLGQPIVALATWDLVGMDYTGTIVPTGIGGKSHILVKVDYFSGFVLLTSTPTPSSVTTITAWRAITPALGYPVQVYSDNASCFSSRAVKSYFASHGTTVTHGPVYSPWSTGMAENVVKMVKQQLKKWAKDRQYENLEEWPTALEDIGHTLNARVGPTGYRADMVRLGHSQRPRDEPRVRQRPIGERLNAVMSETDAVRTQGLMVVERREAVANEIIDNRTEGSAVDQRPDMDRGHDFFVGQWVWEMIPKTKDVKLKHLKDVSAVNPNGDLRTPVFYPAWTGPWEILGHASPVSVIIIDPVTRHRRRKVHVRNLKPYVTANDDGARGGDDAETMECGTTGDANGEDMTLVDITETWDLRDASALPPRKRHRQL